MHTKQDGTRRAAGGSHGRGFEEAARQHAERPDTGNAFIPDPNDGPPRVVDEFAAQIAEHYVQSATSGVDTTEEYEDHIEPEEMGGPFLITTAAQELADDTDATNPEDAEVEPFPRATRAPLP
ncbi:hypothetical protein SOCEGT47_051530 [Sorangium cellulosum]|uniref:Uncharacterized protein n=1 Tax=Sorangium cellulosum TaxID=56 RepID=A0A4P2Q5B8_SORCE|nr:hypothetical protein [Sorangium cellulosum]AUX24614.1 hypothetical protein SOCEGT47_051530 [Sorangium cellulosum]